MELYVRFYVRLGWQIVARVVHMGWVH